MNVDRRPSNPEQRRLPGAVAAVLLLVTSGTAFGQDEFDLEEPSRPPEDPARLAELTEIQNTVEIGVGQVSDDSFRFGRYTGLEDQGFFGVLNMDYLWRGPYDGESAEYFSLEASDMGLSSRDAGFEYGRQGEYAFHARYDQISYFRSDSTDTIFEGAGTALLTLPGGWVPAANTGGMTALNASLQHVSLDQDRERWEIGFERRLRSYWKFSTSVLHEDRQGTKSLGGVIGNSGGNPRAVQLPEPIEYRTNTFDANAAYANGGKQFRMRYHLSVFENDIVALMWQNPYAAIGGWDPSAGYPTGFGQISLPPDNRFHQVDVSGGFNLTANTRLTADIAMGRMTQDEPFLPYTVNPVLAASVTQPLPRTSLDGRIDTTVTNLRLTSNPGAHFYWGMSFRYDDRDNRTPRDEYVYIGGDSQVQDTSIASSRRRYNEPYSYEEMRLRLDAGYRMSGSGRLSAAVERREVDRTFSEREEATDDTITVAWNQDISDWFSASLRFERADRDGSTYRGEEPFLSGYDPGYTSTVPGPWENPPALRKFHQADRERNQASLIATLTPSAAWSIGLEADLAQDDYESSELGVTQSDVDAYSLDLSYAPCGDCSAYAFYTFEKFRTGQDGHSVGGATRVADAANPARAWQARHDDRVDTVGAGFTIPLIENRLEAGIEMLFAKSRSDVEVTTGTALTSAPLPRIKTRLESLGVRAGIRLRESLMLNLRYWYERYRSNDWALDGVEANQLANVILMGDTSAAYTVHVVSVSTSLRF